jgi:hypothetical protein
VGEHEKGKRERERIRDGGSQVEERRDDDAREVLCTVTKGE